MSDLTPELLRTWAKLPSENIYENVLQHLCNIYGADLDETQIHPPLSPGFWRSYRQNGSYNGCNKAGILAFRATLELVEQAYEKFRFKLVEPFIGASRRLYREFHIDRFVRVKVSIDAQRMVATDAEQKPFAHKCLKERFYLRPLSILGREYRAFHEKGGGLYFVATHSTTFVSDNPPIDSWAFEQFVDKLIPLGRARNCDLTLPKLAARIDLWLSKTVKLDTPVEVRWVPDITNHTLPISVNMMQKIADKAELGYRPSELCRNVYNR